MPRYQSIISLVFSIGIAWLGNQTAHFNSTAWVSLKYNIIYLSANVLGRLSLQGHPINLKFGAKYFKCRSPVFRGRFLPYLRHICVSQYRLIRSDALLKIYDAESFSKGNFTRRIYPPLPGCWLTKMLSDRPFFPFALSNLLELMNLRYHKRDWFSSVVKFWVD